MSVNVNRLSVTSTGPDDHSGFRMGCLVEIIHETEELEGRPGSLALIADVDPAASTITLAQLDSQPIEVQVANRCGPVRGVPVRFTVQSGGGTVNLNCAPRSNTNASTSVLSGCDIIT